MDFLVSNEFVAGWIGGSIGIIATQPFDTIRIRTQLYKGTSLSIREHAIIIVKHEGIMAFWRGVASPSLTYGLMSALQFQTYDIGKNVIGKMRKNDVTYSDMVIAAGIAGTVACVVASPTELIKIEAQKTNQRGTATIGNELKTGWNIFKQHGLFRGIYHGFGVCALRDGIAFSAYFPTYEYLKRNFNENSKSTGATLIFGSTAGVVAWFVSYPFDYIKTHYQTRCHLYGQIQFIQAVLYHYKQEPHGFTAFYTGFRATLARVIPQHAILFVCYEKVKTLMNGRIS